MSLLFASLIAQAAIALPDERQVDIPSVYQGRWALSAEFCNDPGPAVVQIGPRRISFFERRGYLQLAQINGSGEDAEFYGSFQFAQTLKFWVETLKLSIKGGHLFIDERPGGTGDRREEPWYRCQT